MTDSLTTGKSIQLMRNVPLMTALIKRGQKRAFGLPGILVFYGEPGLGKSMACAYAAANLDAIHISVQELWTKKTLLNEVLRELRIHPKRTLAEMMMQVNEGLAVSGRTLIIDEADEAIRRNMLGVIRGMQDGSHVPVVLVGMELLPEKLKKWELVHSRVLQWQQAEYATAEDARMLADIYAPDIEIADDLIGVVVQRNRGVARRIANDLAHIHEQCNLQALQQIDAAMWGKAAFPRNEPPLPRPTSLGRAAK